MDIIISIVIFLIFVFPFLFFYYKSIRLDKKISNFDYRKIYYSKKLMSKIEIYFFEILSKLNTNESGVIVLPQIPLSAIVEKQKTKQDKFQNELYRVLDFALFDSRTYQPLLVIEINDKTHNESRRQYRDIRVKEILNEANIKIITFYTNYDNKPNYILERVTKELDNI